MRARRLAAAAAVAAAVSGTTACQAAKEPGAAAIVGGDRITVSHVVDLTREMRDAGAAVDPDTKAPLEGAEAQRRVLGALIESPVIARAAQDDGVSLTQGEIDARITQLVQDRRGISAVRDQLAKSLGLPPSYVDDYARDYVLLEKLQESVAKTAGSDQAKGTAAMVKLFTDASHSLKVTVNPRYGVWQPDKLRVEPGGGPGVVAPGTPAPTPVATAPGDEGTVPGNGSTPAG